MSLERLYKHTRVRADALKIPLEAALALADIVASPVPVTDLILTAAYPTIPAVGVLLGSDVDLLDGDTETTTVVSLVVVGTGTAEVMEGSDETLLREDARCQQLGIAGRATANPRHWMTLEAVGADAPALAILLYAELIESTVTPCLSPGIACALRDGNSLQFGW